MSAHLILCRVLVLRRFLLLLLGFLAAAARVVSRHVLLLVGAVMEFSVQLA